MKNCSPRSATLRRNFFLDPPCRNHSRNVFVSISTHTDTQTHTASPHLKLHGHTALAGSAVWDFSCTCRRSQFFPFDTQKSKKDDKTENKRIGIMNQNQEKRLTLWVLGPPGLFPALYPGRYSGGAPVSLPMPIPECSIVDVGSTRLKCLVPPPRRGSIGLVS